MSRSNGDSNTSRAGRRDRGVFRLTPDARPLMLSALLAATVLLSSCSVSPPAVFQGTTEQLSGPVRVSWYLSPEFDRDKNIRIVDTQLRRWAKSSRDAEISSRVVRPQTADIKPAFLLPIPSPRQKFGPQNLWAGLVLDWRNRRVVIPDVLEPEWFPLDFLRALEDLQRGGAMKIAYLDGNPNGEALPLAMLQGRWTLAEWEDNSPLPAGTEVILIRDGPGLEQDSGYLAAFLLQFAESGGGVLVVPSSLSGSPQALSVWAESVSGEQEKGRILYVDDTRLLDMNSYLSGRNSMRILDSVLLKTAGRDEVLSLFPQDDSRRIAGGRRFRNAGHSDSGFDFPVSEKVRRIVFGADDFRLERVGTGNNSEWQVVSGEWRLPAREDRIESFLRRARLAADNAWEVTTDAQVLDSLMPGTGTRVTFETRDGREITLHFGGQRESGGGYYSRYNGSLYLLEHINGDEISGDSRYFTELRLFPEISATSVVKPIRFELNDGSTVAWRLHQSGEQWFLRLSDASTMELRSDLAEDFARRVGRIEALAASPEVEARDDVTGAAALELLMEDSRGALKLRSLFYWRADGLAALMPDGMTYLLDEEDSALIVNGPVPNLLSK